MDDRTKRRLVELNAKFYDEFAAVFSTSRSAPQPGYLRLLAYAQPESGSVLDIGCGNGRFGQFLMEQGSLQDYTGVDFSERLLAESSLPGRYISRDLSRPDCLNGLGLFNFVVCLSTLQHIPGRATRHGLFTAMRECLHPGGYLALANWQFLDSPRQRRKIRPWSAAGLADDALERGDYLLSWERGGSGIRYVALIDEAETQVLAAAANMRIIEQFRSDGREGNLNLYTILAG